MPDSGDNLRYLDRSTRPSRSTFSHLPRLPLRTRLGGLGDVVGDRIDDGGGSGDPLLGQLAGFGGPPRLGGLGPLPNSNSLQNGSEVEVSYLADNKQGRVKTYGAPVIFAALVCPLNKNWLGTCSNSLEYLAKYHLIPALARQVCRSAHHHCHLSPPLLQTLTHTEAAHPAGLYSQIIVQTSRLSYKF